MKYEHRNVSKLIGCAKYVEVARFVNTFKILECPHIEMVSTDNALHNDKNDQSYRNLDLQEIHTGRRVTRIPVRRLHRINASRYVVYRPTHRTHAPGRVPPGGAPPQRPHMCATSSPRHRSDHTCASPPAECTC